MAYPFREDWIQKALEEKETISAPLAVALGSVAWLAYAATGRRCTLKRAAEAVEIAHEVFKGENVTVLSYLQMVEYTEALIEEHLRNTAQSGSVDQAGGEQDPASS
jgi:hypothetical protein